MGKGHQGPCWRPDSCCPRPSYLSSLKWVFIDSALIPILITNDFHVSFPLAKCLGFLLCQDKCFPQDEPMMLSIFLEVGKGPGWMQFSFGYGLLESLRLKTYLWKGIPRSGSQRCLPIPVVQAALSSWAMVWRSKSRLSTWRFGGLSEQTQASANHSCSSVFFLPTIHPPTHHGCVTTKTLFFQLLAPKL